MQTRGVPVRVSRHSRLALAGVLVVALTLALGTPAFACRTGGQVYFASDGANFGVGQFTTAYSYRGVHGGISVGNSSAPPDIDDYHISVQIASSQPSPGSQFGAIWSQVGWQMGNLVRLPSGARVYSSSATIYFEGIDNVENYGLPYDYANFGNYDHFTVSGP